VATAPKRKNSRRKGARGEVEAAKAWTAAGLGAAKRGQQHEGSEGRDIIIELPGIHVEVKRTEALSLYPAMEQAARDTQPGEVPILLHRRNGKRWLVVVELEELRRLVSFIARAAQLEPGRSASK